MSKHVLLVLTNPVEGKEDEYNEWYTNTHIREVVDIPGFASAQRFELSDTQMGKPGDHRYLAIYEIEAPDVGSALEALRKARPNMQMSDALDTSSIGAFAFTPITEKLGAD